MEMTSIIENMVSRAASATPVQDGDFLQDGLLHCGKCRTPKQCRVEFGGKLYTPSCLCRCETERIAEEQREKAREEQERKVQRMRRLAFPDLTMQAWNFARDDGTDERTTGVMKRYVDHFAELRKKGKGLLLYGPVGTGKTFAACEVANALIDRGIPCYVTNFARLSNTIQGLFDDRQCYIDSLSRYDLLVIDDLGAERKSEYMQEIVWTIIDARYRSGKPMIITTNLSMDEIKNPANINYSRIYDRIIERCFPLEVAGKSRRRAAVRADYDATKALLGL